MSSWLTTNSVASFYSHAYVTMHWNVLNKMVCSMQFKWNETMKLCTAKLGHTHLHNQIYRFFSSNYVRTILCTQSVEFQMKARKMCMNSKVGQCNLPMLKICCSFSFHLPTEPKKKTYLCDVKMWFHLYLEFYIRKSSWIDQSAKNVEC